MFKWLSTYHWPCAIDAESGTIIGLTTLGYHSNWDVSEYQMALFSCIRLQFIHASQHYLTGTVAPAVSLYRYIFWNESWICLSGSSVWCAFVFELGGLNSIAWHCQSYPSQDAKKTSPPLFASHHICFHTRHSLDLWQKFHQIPTPCIYMVSWLPFWAQAFGCTPYAHPNGTALFLWTVPCRWIAKEPMMSQWCLFDKWAMSHNIAH